MGRESKLDPRSIPSSEKIEKRSTDRGRRKKKKTQRAKLKKEKREIPKKEGGKTVTKSTKGGLL